MAVASTMFSSDSVRPTSGYSLAVRTLRRQRSRARNVPVEPVDSGSRADSSQHGVSRGRAGGAGAGRRPRPTPAAPAIVRSRISPGPAGVSCRPTLRSPRRARSGGRASGRPRRGPLPFLTSDDEGALLRIAAHSSRHRSTPSRARSRCAGRRRRHRLRDPSAFPGQWTAGRGRAGLPSPPGRGGLRQLPQVHPGLRATRGRWRRPGSSRRCASGSTPKGQAAWIGRADFCLRRDGPSGRWCRRLAPWWSTGLRSRPVTDRARLGGLLRQRALPVARERHRPATGGACSSSIPEPDRPCSSPARSPSTGPPRPRRRFPAPSASSASRSRRSSRRAPPSRCAGS